ncbi:hypothetical protein ACFWIZ_55065, partial [Streptomyces sp. NPDC127044]
MRIARTAGTVFVAGALVMTLAALAYPSMLGLQTTAADQSRVIANTSTGPVTEADRDFVVKVRAAGLWEYPVGMLGLQKGTTPAVRTARVHKGTGPDPRDHTQPPVAP